MTLAPSSQGTGIATEALGAVVAMLIDEHQIHRVFAHVDDRNLSSRRLFEVLLRLPWVSGVVFRRRVALL